MTHIELPYNLQVALEQQTSRIKLSLLISDASDLSERYRNESGKGNRLLTKDSQAAAYSVVRMPATYGAVYTALSSALLHIGKDEFKTLLDVGAGTGAGTWACGQLLSLSLTTCLERENAMSEFGKKMMDGCDNFINTKWIDADITKDDMQYSADLVICSYVLNELSSDKRMSIVDKIWKCTDKMLLIVDPGTPAMFDEMREIRTHLLGLGAHILAPCTHENPCPVESPDWCHFTCRIARTKLHKLLKSGDAPYEDEKFTYMVFTKTPHIKAISRIRRHPHIEPKKITLELCTASGLISRMFTKKDKEMFKKARKSDCNDEI